MAETLALADADTSSWWDTLSLGYTYQQGAEALRQEIVRNEYSDNGGDGATTAILEQEITAACNSSSGRQRPHVIATAPAYQSLTEIARSMGCEVTLWRPEAESLDTRPRFSAERLEELVRRASTSSDHGARRSPGRTRMVVINFPHNPTGALLTRSELQRVVEICRSSGIFLLSDEMYRGLEHSVVGQGDSIVGQEDTVAGVVALRPSAGQIDHFPRVDLDGEQEDDVPPARRPVVPAPDPAFARLWRARRLPAVCELYERGISLGGMSKTYSMPGLRIGWLGFGAEVRAEADKDIGGVRSDIDAVALQKRVHELKDYTTICPSAPSEVLAVIGLRAGDRIARRNLGIVREGLASLRDFLGQSPQFAWAEPTAGSFAFPRLLRGIQESVVDSAAYCRRLEREHGIMLLPSSFFEADMADRFRVTYGRANTSAIVTKWREIRTRPARQRE